LNSTAVALARRTTSRTPSTAVLACVVLLAAVAGCVAWTLHAGPEWSWDRVHYHEYAGWQMFEDGPGRGFAPAGPQGFLNPVAHVPAQLLARAGLDELGVALWLSVLHASGVLLAWVVSRLTIARPGHDDGGAAEVAALLAFLTPLFLLQVGSVSIDITTTLPVLAAVACGLCAVGAAPREALRWTAAAGLAFGLAAGLKLSNAIPAVAGTVLVLWGASPRAWPARVAAFAVAGAIGALVAHGWWSARLLAEFGSPFYPMFGNVFGPAPSPAAVSAVPASAGSWYETLRAAGGRFTPRDLSDWISFPLRVADPSIMPAYGYIESRQPDPRLVLLGVASLLAAAAAVVRGVAAHGRVGSAAVAAVPPVACGRSGPSRLASLVAFWVVWYVAWVVTSSNGRYATGLLMLASPLIVAALRSVFRDRRVRAYATLAVVVVQATWALAVSDPRSSAASTDWKSGTQRLEVPAELREIPTLQITRMAMSWSALAPHLHPESAFATLGSACEGCGPGLDPAAAGRVLSAWSGRARMLDPVLGWAHGRPEIAAAQQAGIDAALAPYDLRVDPDACLVIGVRPNPMRIQMREQQADGNWTQRESDRLASCRVVAAPGAAERARAMAVRVDPAFESIEARCSATLGRPSGPTRWAGDGIWARTYPRLGVEVRVVGDSVTAFSELGQGRAVSPLAALLGGTAEIDCAALTPTQSSTWRASGERSRSSGEVSFDALVRPAAPTPGR
jgi:hypothetical protein